MSADLRAAICEIRDRQEIYDCMMRYCRGIDRLDRALLESCYHPDAYDAHGSAYSGPASGFIDWVLPLYREHKIACHHVITNHYVELDGDVAHAESYYVSTSIDARAPHHSLVMGRYVDRLEKRDGRWAIADRVCLVEISPPVVPAEIAQLAREFQPRDRTDVSYQRPLKIDRNAIQNP